MADLPTVADRLNDTEITANAPLTETLMRRIGSNINFLLDFLGVSDGATAPSGSLNELAQAVDTIDNHTIDLQTTILPGSSGTVSVGTFVLEKFVNQIFYGVWTSVSPLQFGLTEDWGSLGIGAPNGNKMLLNIDSAGSAPMVDPSAKDESEYLQTDILEFPSGPASTVSNRIFSKHLDVGEFSFDFAGTGGTPTRQFIKPLCYLDWRDGSSFQLDIQNTDLTPASTRYVDFRIYREFRLDIHSAKF